MSARLTAMFVSLLGLLASAMPARPAGSSLLATVPFEVAGGRILLKDVTLNDVPGQVLVFDSGAGSSGIYAGEAGRLGLVPDGEVEVRGGGGRARVGTTSGNRVAFGDVVLRDLTLAHFPRPAFVASDGARAAGIVGYDLLKDHVVRLDFDRGVLEIHDGRSYRAAGRSLPLLVRGRTPGLQATVELPGGVTVTDEFGLDLGAPYAVHFDSAFVARHRLLGRREGLVRRTMRGVGPAVMVACEGRVPGLRVGASAVRDVPALFDEASAEVHREDGRIGVMGLAFLRRFNLVFDYGRGRVELEPNGSFDAPFVVPPAGRPAATKEEAR